MKIGDSTKLVLAIMIPVVIVSLSLSATMIGNESPKITTNKEVRDGVMYTWTTHTIEEFTLSKYIQMCVVSIVGLLSIALMTELGERTNETTDKRNNNDIRQAG